MDTSEHDANTVVDLRPPTSTQRAPTGGYRTRQQREEAQAILDGVPRHVRAGHQRPRRADEQALNTNTTRNVSRQRSPYRADEATQSTNDDDQLRYQRRVPTNNRRIRRTLARNIKHYWLRWMFFGACSLLVLWIIGINAFASAMNSVVTPISQVQTVSYADVSVHGHSERIQAIIDSNDHLDVLVTIDGDIAHAKLEPGTQILNMRDPQHARLHVDTHTSRDGHITAVVVADGPIQVTGLTTTPESSSWQFDIPSSASKGVK